MANIDTIKVPNGTSYELQDKYKSGVYFVMGTQTASTDAWTGALHGVSALFNGLTILYYLPKSSSANATLNLTLDDGTTTGAISCSDDLSDRLTHYAEGAIIRLTYISGTEQTEARWRGSEYRCYKEDAVKHNVAIGDVSFYTYSERFGSAVCALAEGQGTTASGNYSHSEGGGTTASGSCAHSEGGSTTASGACAHSEGGSTTASGEASHAEGSGTTASGEASHAGGGGTIASKWAQTAVGRYNLGTEPEQIAFLVGGGTGAKTENRRTVFGVSTSGMTYSSAGFTFNTNITSSFPTERLNWNYTDVGVSTTVGIKAYLKAYLKKIVTSNAGLQGGVITGVNGGTPGYVHMYFHYAVANYNNTGLPRKMIGIYHGHGGDIWQFKTEEGVFYSRCLFTASSPSWTQS